MAVVGAGGLEEVGVLAVRAAPVVIQVFVALPALLEMEVVSQPLAQS